MGAAGLVNAKISVAIFPVFALVLVGLSTVVGSRDNPAKPAPAAGSASESSGGSRAVGEPRRKWCEPTVAFPGTVIAVV